MHIKTIIHPVLQRKHIPATVSHFTKPCAKYKNEIRKYKNKTLSQKPPNRPQSILSPKYFTSIADFQYPGISARFPHPQRLSTHPCRIRESSYTAQINITSNAYAARAPTPGSSKPLSPRHRHAPTAHCTTRTRDPAPFLPRPIPRQRPPACRPHPPHPEATMNTIQGTSLEANSPTVAPSAITHSSYSTIRSTRTNPAEAIR